MSRSYEYSTVDVFTDQAFGGNPLAVILDARTLTTEQMQSIAAEFNYSESTFVLLPEGKSHTARVRIFTPKDEIPFAGHPNVGTAFALAQDFERRKHPFGSTLVFEEKAGLVPVELIRSNNGQLTGATLTAPQSLTLGLQISPETIAQCAGLDPENVVSTPIVASVGLPFVLAEVTREAMERARPNIAAFTSAANDSPSRPGRFSLHLYARDGGSAGPATHLRARMFAPLSGVSEDPATGSANAALGAYLANKSPAEDAVLVYEIQQGVEMGRPSLLRVTVEKREGAIASVRVGGSCVPLMRGTITL